MYISSPLPSPCDCFHLLPAETNPTLYISSALVALPPISPQLAEDEQRLVTGMAIHVERFYFAFAVPLRILLSKPHVRPTNNLRNSLIVNQGEYAMRCEFAKGNPFEVMIGGGVNIEDELIAPNQDVVPGPG